MRDRTRDAPIFVAAVFVPAFLLFLVQPLVAKRVLPWFGGAPGVWSLCLAFYQTTLFLGYAYAHLLIRRAPPRLQLGVHALLVGLALLALPVLPGDAWRPADPAAPSRRILVLLAANVGLPFLVLAATGPLVQAWFARRHPQRSPYPLYACSNLGSLLALLAYPFWIEPWLGVWRTGELWSLGFALAGAAVLLCAALAARSGPAAGGVPVAAPVAAAARADVVLWLLLSACAVVLLMAVTNKLCIDVASVPFLWVIPLAAYLLSFIVCFASERAYRRAPWVALALLAALPTLGAGLVAGWLDEGLRAVLWSPPAQITGYCVLLAALCMLLHGELYRLRPAPGALTAYYLCVSAGGALGGIFVGIGAPLLFEDYHELEVGIGLAALLLLAVCARDPASALHVGSARGRVALALAVAALLAGFAPWGGESDGFVLLRQERSFFGVYRVVEETTRGTLQRRLLNGTTVHGVELAERFRRLPTSYYGRASGLGLVLGDREGERPARIGVVGLGIGTVAAYAREGERIRFYEIDPAVVRIARDEGLFHFLEDCRAELEVVEGDARLAIADEQARGADQAFDFLVIDAFNSDAVPVHLLTVEAFAHYAAALAPGGLIAVHASNRHFELMPLVARVGGELSLHALQVVNARARRFQSKPSQWVWLGADPDRVREIGERIRRRHEALGLAPADLHLTPADPGALRNVPVWTDDYSDLFGVLRRRGGTAPEDDA